MAFVKPGRQSPEETSRRQAVKVDVATDVRDTITDRIAVGVEERGREGIQRFRDATEGKRRQLIGPSWLGRECEFCVGAKIAGLEQEKDFGWLAFIGNEVHDALSDMFAEEKSRWLTEHFVEVGEIDGHPVAGFLDLFAVEYSTVVDFKIVGDRKLEKVRFTGEIPPEYDVQADAYGLGLRRQGWKVTHVAVYFMPRSVWIKKPRELWSRGFWWAKEYDESNALQALERADRIARHIRLAGADAVLPTLERMEGCFDCKRWKYQKLEVTA